MAVSRSWTLDSIPEKKGNEKGKKKEMVNPIFAEYAKLSNDPYWQELLTQCAYKKFPRGFSYKSGVMIFRKNNKVNQLQLSPDNREALIQIMDWFYKHGNYGAPQEEKIVINEKIAKQIYPSKWEWKDIKVEKLKLNFIDEYIRKLAADYKMSKEDFRELKRCVRVGLVLGNICNEDITFQNGEVTHIDGIVIAEKNGGGRYTFHCENSTNIKRSTKREPKEKENIFINNWNTYLDHVMGRIQNRGNTTRSLSSLMSARVSESVRNIGNDTPEQ